MKNAITFPAPSIFLFLMACEQVEPAPSEGFTICETKPTTRIALQGNLDASAERWGLPSFIFSISIIDDAGLPLTAEIEFTATRSLSWSYEVRGRGLGIGAGTLDFSDEGRLASHKVVQALRVPELSGNLGPAVTLFLGSPVDEGGNGLDGLTGYAANSGITVSTLNGLDPMVADACADAAQEPDTQHRDPQTGACLGHPTTEIRLTGNLDATSPYFIKPWDLERARIASDFSYPMLVYGPGGVNVAITSFFVKSTSNVWVYHVALGWDKPTRLLTTGTLTFSDSGALVHRKDFSVLRIPDGLGELGPPVVLELGLPQDLGADGLSGLTGRADVSAITSAQVNGHPAVVGGFCE